MTSGIDPTKPASGAPTTQSVRENFADARAEILALQDADVTLQASITAIGPELDALDGRVSASDVDIAANAADIATNAAAIAAHTTDITTANGNIATNTADIAANAATIAGHTTDIATTNGNVATNTADIAANAATIAGHTTDITTANGNIAKNTADIATNAAAIVTLGTDMLPKAGGTMTGALTLAGAPTVDLHPATKKYVDDNASSVLPYTLTPAMAGVGSAGVAATYARGDHVHPSDTSRAPLASPTFTGAPSLPTGSVGVTQTPGNSSLALATTAFVAVSFATIASLPVASAVTPVMNGVGAVGVAAAFARGDHVHPSDTSRAPTASPTFTGTVTLPTGAVGVTQTLGTNTTALATTAFVLANAISAASPTFTGTVTLPATVTTAAAGTTFASPNSTGSGVSGALTVKTGSGTSSNAVSGILTMATGAGIGTGVSGNVNITTGASVTGVSGDINLTTGVASGNWSGNIYLKTGAEASTNWSGSVGLSTGAASGSGGAGDISLNPGNAAGAGNGGNVSVNPGASATGQGGSFNVQTATATTTGKSGGVLLATGTAATTALRGIVQVVGRTFIKPAGGGTSEDDVASDLQVIGNSRVSGSTIIGAAAGPTIRSGTGAATGTQPAGSMWLRTDGSAGARVYISAGAGSWVAIAAV